MNNPECTEQCLICLENYDLKDLVKLSCNHFFCKICFFKLCHDKILSGNFSVSLVKCPKENCEKQISLEFLKGVLSKEKYEKIEDICNKNAELSCQGEKSITCPKCDIVYVIWRDADYFDCKNCKIQYCSQCYGEMIKHKSMTCKEYDENKNLSADDQDFFKSMKEKGFKRCPVCFCFVERSGGCNFIRCCSYKCNKKTTFCFLCGLSISEKEHYSHYLLSPFEEPCCKQNNIQQIMMDKTKMEQEDDESLWIKCPECKIRDGKTCTIEKGIDVHFCCCTSEKCKGKLFCLLCNKIVQDRHFDMHLKGKCIQSTCIIF